MIPRAFAVDRARSPFVFLYIVLNIDLRYQIIKVLLYLIAVTLWDTQFCGIMKKLPKCHAQVRP